jgi:hypothetical protein
MPFLDEIANRLVAQGAGTVSADIFKGSKAVIPSGDGPYLSVIETGGTRRLASHNGTAVTRPSAQLLCRAKSYQAARARLSLAFAALGGAEGLHNVTLDGTFYQSIVPRQEPTDIGLDTEARPMIVFNIDVEKEPS